MVGKISWDLPHEEVVKLLNIMYKSDADGNKPKGIELKDIIVNYVQDNLKIITDSMERQYKELNLELSQAIKEDIIIAIIAQYMAEDAQYAYDSEMYAKTVALTLDTSNVGSISGYNHEVADAGYKRQGIVDELILFTS